MSNLYYADVEYIEKAINRVREETTFDGPDANISVFETHVVMPGIDHETFKDRNLENVVERSLCNLRYDGVRWTLQFHENTVQEDFWLRPAGLHGIDAKQAPDPDKFAPHLKPVVEAIEEAFDVVSWDFMEVSAASMASGGHFTDFEWKYVITGI